MSSKKGLKFNSLLSLIKTLSSILFPLITFPYISRVLMPENVGRINFSLSFVSYFALIAALGITTYAVRECSAVRHDEKEISKVASQIYSINICTTVFAYVLIAVSLFAFRDLDSYKWLILIQSLTIAFTTIGTDWVNTAMEDFTYITIRTVAFQLVSLALIFFFVRSSNDSLIYAAITVISVAGANLLNIFYRRKYFDVHFTMQMNWKVHFPPIFFLFVQMLAGVVLANADITMIGLMRSDFEVGVYSTAVKVQLIVAQVLTSLAWVVMPRLSLYFSEGNFFEANALLRKILGAFLLVGLPIVAGVISLSSEIILILAGASYSTASIPLAILMVSILFSIIGGSFLGNIVCLSLHQEKKYMLVCCLAAVFNVIANSIFIPSFGITAAALTTVFSSVLMTVLLVATVDRRIDFGRVGGLFAKPFIGSLVIFIYCAAMHQTFSDVWIVTGVCIVGSFLLYGITQIALKNEILLQILTPLKTRLKRFKAT